MYEFPADRLKERRWIRAPRIDDPDTKQALRRLASDVSDRANRAVWHTVYQYAEPPQRLRTDPPPWGPVFDAVELFVDIVTDTPPTSQRLTLEHFIEIGRTEADSGHDLDAVCAANAYACSVASALLRHNGSALGLPTETLSAMVTAADELSFLLESHVVAGYGEVLGLEAEIESCDHYSGLRQVLLFGPADDLEYRYAHCEMPYPEYVSIVVTALDAIGDVDQLTRTLDTPMISRSRGLFILLVEATVASALAQTVVHHTTAPVVVGSPVPPPELPRAQRLITASFREAEQTITRPVVVLCDPDQRLA